MEFISKTRVDKLYNDFKRVRSEYRKLRKLYFQDTDAELNDDYFSYRGYYQGMGRVLRSLGVKNAK